MADNHKAIAACFGHMNTPRGNEQGELEHARFDTSVLACWFHQKQDLERELPKKIVNREHEAEIVADIRALHQIPYPFEHLFDMALRAFHRKWWDDEQAVVQYIDGWDNRKWSLAHRPAGLPTTNNSHERLNRELKDFWKMALTTRITCASNQRASRDVHPVWRTFSRASKRPRRVTEHPLLESLSP